MKKNRSQQIAVVGLSCIFPESINSQIFWKHILNCKDFITDVPPSHWLVEDYYDPDPKGPGKTYCKRGSFLTDISFNPVEFGMPPNIIKSTDTSQLLALITAKKLLDDVISVKEDKVNKKNISVILGKAALTEQACQMSAKTQKPVWVKILREHGIPESKVQSICENVENNYPEWNENIFPGLLPNVITGRIANRLDLGGTNYIVDAACASSLAAVNIAIKELELGRMDMVISGGSDVLSDIFMFLCFSKTPALSLTGDCRPFSDKADGTILGEGVGMLALRRLEDARRDGDKIYAIINSIGTSSDGSSKSVYAPDSKGQALSVRRAYKELDYTTNDVELIETHGTGTIAGDIAEFEGLKIAFGDEKKKQFCAIGSIKSQIGHTKAAAGFAGLFKAIMALHHKILPPTIKVDQPNQKLDIKNSPFYLNTETRPWIHEKGSTRKASVSSFGFGGTNFHVTLEEYKGKNIIGKKFYIPNTELILFSSDSKEEIILKIRELIKDLEKKDIIEIARRSQESFRYDNRRKLALLISDKDKGKLLAENVIKKIDINSEEYFSILNQAYYSSSFLKGKTAFIFAGQGSQYLNMGANLAMQFEEARRVWDDTINLDLDKEKKLHNVVFPKPVFNEEDRKNQLNKLTETKWAQPAIGTVSLSQLALLNKIGIKADCTAGHSYGEIVALYAGGVIQSEEDMIRISRRRGELMAETSKQKGAMTAVFSNLKDIKETLNKWQSKVTIANINSPTQIVLAGRLKDIENIEQKFNEISVQFRRLPVPTAFHSELVSPSAEDCYKYIKSFNFNLPKVPVYSNTTGKLYPEDVEKIKKIIADQLAHPVLFKDQIELMYKNGVKTFIEIGPGTILSGLVKECLGDKDYVVVSIDGGKKQKNGVDSFWNALGILAVNGINVNFIELWDEFEEIEQIIDENSLSKTTVKIKGCNYGKLYPPKNGAKGIPKPNPEIVEKKLEEKIIDSKINIKNDNVQEVYDDSHKFQTTNNSDWLKVLYDIKKETLDAQKVFQDTLAESHKSFLKVGEETIKTLSEMAEKKFKSNQHLSTEEQAKLVNVIKQEEEDIKFNNKIAQTPEYVMREQEIHPKENTVNLTRDFKSILLKIVSEKTGYPEDMLELDMDLESGLGIDSIKRVEILSALQEEFPELKQVDTSKLTALNTLGEILDFAKQTAGQKTESISNMLQSVDVNTELTSKDFKNILLKIVSEKTGYPEDMLELDMDLESGLGIDSIKRVEILSALQEELPELKQVDTSKLAALNTLGEILEFAQDSKSSVNKTSSVVEIKEEIIERKNKIFRYIVEEYETPACGVALSGIKEQETIYIIKDNKGVAEILSKKLKKINIKNKVVEDIEEGTKGVIYLKGINNLEEKNELISAINLNKEVFGIAKKCGQVLFKDRGLFVTVQDTNGDKRGWIGGINALTKTAGLEWGNAEVKSIDIESEKKSKEKIAEEIYNELVFGGTEKEVIIKEDGKRYSKKVTISEIKEKNQKFQKGDVIVVTGGARGVTAECLKELAEREELNIAILGRTKLEEESVYLKNSKTDAELKKEILEKYRENGENITPIELSNEVKKIISIREVKNNIKELEKSAKVKYYAVDVCEEKEVKNVINEIRDVWGDIKGIIHGAGVLNDKYIHEKTREQFDKVFNTKVIGFKNLLKATKKDKLTHICCFSSVAARLGNKGQVDYAMANEILNKVCQIENERRNGECVVKSINWGPWAGGMVSKELKKHFENQGIALIPLNIGANIFADELEDRSGKNIETVVGGVLENWGEKGKRDSKWYIFIDKRTYPFLLNHSIQGFPVVPLVMAHELCLRVAISLYPDKKNIISKKFKVLKGIQLPDFEKKGLWICMDVNERKEEDIVFLDFIIESLDKLKYYSVTIELKDNREEYLTAPSYDVDKFESWDWDKETIYNEKLFHGKDFYVIEKIIGSTDTEYLGVLKTNNSLTREEDNWRSDVAILDGGLQLSLLWEIKQRGYESLPVGFESLSLYKGSLYKGLICCYGKLIKKSEFQANWDISFIDKNNELVAEMKGLIVQNGVEPDLYKLKKKI